jgi:Beta protein
MDFNYIPILRWKRGERAALGHVTAPGHNDVRPLIRLAPKQYVEHKATRSKPLVIAPDAFAIDMTAAWGAGEFYLDASELPDGAGDHPMAQIAASARACGLRLIPATRLIAPPSYRHAIRQIERIDRRGVALSVNLREFTDAAQWATQWEYPRGSTDLIADFAGSVSTVAALGASLIHGFQTLHGAADWRSVTIAGTSMMDNFSGLGQGHYTIDRVEWSLWSTLNAGKLQYRVNYGDYATVPVVPAPEGIKWGFPINVRYTAPDRFFICRGVQTTGINAVDMDEQLIRHAESISKWAPRGKLDFCWADQRIDCIAARQEGPGNLERWVQIGVNRHIELVRSALP